MRLHTDTLTENDLRALLLKAKKAGLVAFGVYFTVLDPHRSRTHNRAFEVQLGANWGDKASLVPGSSNQFGKPQKTRRKNQANTAYAATWDEWGWFMAHVFHAERGAVFGSNSPSHHGNWGYRGKLDFHAKTKGRFEL